MMIGKVGAELDLTQLDTLCQERKVEHDRVIRAEVISKLDEIVKNCGPLSEEEEELTRPYGVVHEGQALDVWGHILEKVSDHSEIGNLSEVCEIFQNILRNKYVQARLAEVVKLILDKYPDYLLIAETDDAHHAFRMKIIAKFMTFASIRQVSKQSKKTLESISTDFGLSSLKLGTVEQVHGIVTSLMDNPSYATTFFPNELIIYDCDVRGDLQEFHQSILMFLKFVGHRISRFTYISLLELQAEVYNCIRTWTEFMPNLKHLNAGLGYWLLNDQHVPCLQEVEAFPALPLLQSFEGGDFYTPYIQRILEANLSIGDMRLNQSVSANEHSPHVLETAVRLTSLRIHLYPTLLQYRDFQWKLSKLVLCSLELVHVVGEASRNPKDTISSAVIFPFLKQFEGTLEYLDFGRIDAIYSGEYLELRNLKTLKMEFHKSFENLNFLLYAEKLETLLVKVGRTCMENLSPNEKFSKILEGSFLGKSVWNVFPYLKRLQLCTADYYRYRFRVTGEVFEQFRVPQ